MSTAKCIAMGTARLPVAAKAAPKTMPTIEAVIRYTGELV